MTTDMVSIAIGGYEDCHPVNQPTLQDAFERLRSKVCRLNDILDEVKIFMHVSYTREGFHDSKPKILQMIAFEDDLDTLSSAAPFRKTGV